MVWVETNGGNTLMFSVVAKKSGTLFVRRPFGCRHADGASWRRNGPVNGTLVAGVSLPGWTDISLVEGSKAIFKKK